MGAGADPMMLSKYGDDVLQTACLKGSLHIFNHLLETVFYDPNRIADAFELIGTTFLLDFHDIGSTLFFWRKALEIRYEGDFRYVKKWPESKNIKDKDPFYNTRILIFSFTWAGLAVFPRNKQNIMKVVQS